jgi:hypothetical protein
MRTFGWYGVENPQRQATKYGTASVYVMSIQEHGPIVQARQETCRITYAPAILFRYAYSRKELYSKEVTR